MEKVPLDTKRPETAAWSAYWATAPGAGQAVTNTGLTARLAALWDARLSALVTATVPDRVGELACGSAAVLSIYARRARQLGARSRLWAIDISHEALSRAQETLDGEDVNCVVASADATGLPDGAFDLILSQFGLEYAGAPGFAEAARLLAPGARFIGLVHANEGGIYRENAANAQAIHALMRSGLIARIEDQMRLSVPVEEASDSDGARVDQCATNVLSELRLIAPCAARDYVARLVDDALMIWQSRSRQNHDDRAGTGRWLATQKMALEDYLARMDTMMRASLDRAGLEAIAEACEGQGVIAGFEPLMLGTNAEQIGWIVEAERPAR